MSEIFGFSREAVRVKVKKLEGCLPPEFRKFSVDPQITSFEVLQSILAKAFDLKGDFTVCYRVFDVNGHETYMPLLSDWDLDAAFLKAYNMSMGNSSEPCLCLRVDLKPFEECSDDWELRQNVPIITQIRTVTSSQEAKPSPRLHGIINQMGKTLNMVQKAFNFGEEPCTSIQPPRPPLTDSEFRTFLDPVGQIIYTKELRSVIYFGGIEPSLRKVVWKHLLNVYPDGMTGRERMDYIKRKAAEYINLRETWKNAIAQGPVVGELAYTTGMVKKDVLRTDRHHPFYAGSDDNQNIASLFNILTTYALNHPKVSYCQGMSDLASPLLVTMNDEAHAYICFCGLMQRLNTNFMIDGIAMTKKFTHLAEALMYYDPEFYNYLKIHQADDLLFCYRWLLLEMKREFAFDDSLRMLEILWSSLPADPPEKELKLFDVQFQPITTSTPPISPLVKAPRENPYTKVCALRRQSSSLSLNSFISQQQQKSVVKRQNHSLDETIGRNRNILDIKLKHLSLDDETFTRTTITTKLSPHSPNDLRPRSVSPLELKSDSITLNNNRINNRCVLNKSKSATLSSSMTNLIKNRKYNGHFKDLKDKITTTKLFSSLDSKLDLSIKEELEIKPKGKMIKNLNEFLNFSKDKPKILLTKSDGEEQKNYYSSTSNDDDDDDDDDDDTFDECSPDDSQEYFPLTTSVTRELRLELENLDRKVFGDKYIERLSESPSSDFSCSNNDIKSDNKTTTMTATRDDCGGDDNKIKPDDIFLWENPLHQTSPKLNKTLKTPDEQLNLDYDETPTFVNEESALKTVTPIKIINNTIKNANNKDAQKQININPITNGIVTTPTTTTTASITTNTAEEVTEVVKSSLLPPPNEFGGGNPFLMFLCLTVLLQHREHIMTIGMDYNEMAMHFDKMVRKHNVIRVLNQARQMYARYIKQHTIAQQQKLEPKQHEHC